VIESTQEVPMTGIAPLARLTLATLLLAPLCWAAVAAGGQQEAVRTAGGPTAAGAPPSTVPGKPEAAKEKGQQPTGGEPPRVVMARVGPREITVQEFMGFISQDARLLQKATSPAGKAQILREMIAEMLLQQAATQEGLLKTGPGHKLTQPEYLEAYGKLSAEHFPLPPPYDDKEVYQYYLQHKESFGIPTMVRISQIQFRVKKHATAEEKKAARARAEAALRRLKAGEPFDKLAAELTENHRGRLTGGDLGFLPLHQDPWLESAVKGLKVGQYSGVLESPVGYEIIEFTDQRDALITPFWNVKDQVNKRMRLEAQQRAREAYVKQLANKIGVEILLPGLEAARP
jgi:parvulin-like peptidyl-prolyl isomerase